jgi:hypothetical protein
MDNNCIEEKQLKTPSFVADFRYFEFKIIIFVSGDG